MKVEALRIAAHEGVITAPAQIAIDELAEMASALEWLDGPIERIEAVMRSWESDKSLLAIIQSAREESS